MNKFSIIFLLAITTISCQDFTENLSDTTKDNSVTTRAAGSDGQDYYWYRGEKINLILFKIHIR